ncbi:MAG TPA: DUF5615 family PIN-like protein [Pyrinomonadaceae bacterium]|jgi:predicted nuclease of predicted toxin-antitoxin system|nr:DUF5615 family PIN-like protein [Pyrinomonadaceae bacterium]
MKLLFDQNLSPDLVKRLAELYPDSNHVYQLGLERSSDREICYYALANGFSIVTKDGDYGDLYTLLDASPKIIWIKRGNCSTDLIEQILHKNNDKIESFFQDPDAGVLILF